MSSTTWFLIVVESEISVVLTAMRRGNLWSSNTHQDANTENLIKVWPNLVLLWYSVADPGSGAFLTPGSGINIPDHSSESLKTIFGLKCLNSLMRMRIREHHTCVVGIQLFYVYMHHVYRILLESGFGSALN
jgi:hypothetical protein